MADFCVGQVWALNSLYGVIELLLVDGALAISVSAPEPGQSYFLDVFGVSDGACDRNEPIQEFELLFVEKCWVNHTS